MNVLAAAAGLQATRNGATGQIRNFHVASRGALSLRAVSETLRRDEASGWRESSTPERFRYSSKTYPAIPVPARRPDGRATHRKEVSRRNRSQVGIPCDLVGPRASPFGEISFGQGLQTPGDPPEEMFPVPGSRGDRKSVVEGK